MDTEPAGSIRAGGHNAALIRSSTDREGFTAQGRVTQFFNGAEESIQVEMEDGSGHGVIVADYFGWNKYSR
jgi:hypothetical protein